MTYISHHCPVCLREVSPTIARNIAGHFDSIKSAACLASGEPFHITIELREAIPA